MTDASPYPVSFASPRRDSALPVATDARGVVTWSRDLGVASTPNWPPTVLIWGDHEAVVTYSRVAVLDRDGDLAWIRQKQGGAPAAVEGGLLYLKAKNRFIDAVDSAQKLVIDEAPFPSAMAEDVSVTLFWPRAHDFLAVLFQPAEDSVADGDPPDTPLRPAETTVLRNRYETTYGDWLFPYEAAPRLPALLLPEHHVLTLGLDEAIRIDVADEKELSRFTIPLDHLVEWSLDSHDVYVVTGSSGGHKALVALSATGKELWRWTDTDDNDPWAAHQPPIRAANGRVYALTEGRVLAIEEGRLVWDFDARSDDLRHGARLEEGSFEVRDGVLIAKGRLRNGSVLSDGSLLVTRGGTLRHLGADGRQIFSVAVGEEILSPPVVDAEGHIYVATVSHLVRVD